MVLLSEVGSNNMFWGVSVDGGKRYTQVVETSFHISMAALEPSTEDVPKGKRAVCLWIQHEKAEFLLCTLEHHRTMQQPLDLNFTEGEEITLFTTGGNGSIHLSGYLMDERDDMENEMPDISEEDMSSDELDSDAEVPQLLPLELSNLKPGKKRKLQELDTKKKKQKVLVEEDLDSDDDSEDADYTLGDEDDDMEAHINEVDEDDDDDDSDDDDDDDELEEDDDDEEDEDDDEDDSDEEEEEDLVEKIELQNKNKKKNTPNKNKDQQKTPNSKKAQTPQNKGNNLQTAQNKTPKVNGTPAQTESSKKNKKKKNKDNNEASFSTPTPEKTPKKTETPKKQVLADGLVVEDIKVGNGPPAKVDKMAHMYYVGRLSNGKQFDSCSGGKPFKFRLGKSEVIKGWDVGVKGMKVGGKRRLIVPPKLGYGNHKQGPIPANSTLVFDVELKAVS